MRIRYAYKVEIEGEESYVVLDKKKSEEEVKEMLEGCSSASFAESIRTGYTIDRKTGEVVKTYAQAKKEAIAALSQQSLETASEAPEEADEAEEAEEAEEEATVALPHYCYPDEEDEEEEGEEEAC